MSASSATSPRGKPGHLLVAPRRHVRDALENPSVTATTMYDAAALVDMVRRVDDRYESVNLITSVGTPATQTVFHLHVHIVPRAGGDGLALPWTDQVARPMDSGPVAFDPPLTSAESEAYWAAITDDAEPPG